MEIPKEVIAIRTQEEADACLKQYFEGNERAYEELIKRMHDYEQEHPEMRKRVPVEGEKGAFVDAIEYPEGMGGGLEFVCHISLTAIVENRKKQYTFGGGQLDEYWGSDADYSSVHEMAGAVKVWLEKQSERVNKCKVVPFFYTISEMRNLGDGTTPLGLRGFLEMIVAEEHFESEEDMQKAQDELKNVNFEAMSKSLNNTVERGLTEAEREEFRKAFFSE